MGWSSLMQIPLTRDVGVSLGRLIRAGNPPIFHLDVGRAGKTNPDVGEVMSSCSQDPPQDLNRR